MRLIEFSVPGQPQGKGRARVSTYGGFARAYTPEKTAAYESLIKQRYVLSRQEKLAGALKMSLRAYYAIPQSFSRKKRIAAVNGEIRPVVKPDMDNVIKVVCDALNGLAYDDDRQITEITARKYYGEEARVEIEITEETDNDT